MKVKGSRIKLDVKTVLPPRERERVFQELMDVRDLWMARRSKNPRTGNTYNYDFYTVFAASYIDASGDRRSREEYYALARRFNPLLKRRFEFLYEAAFERLKFLLGAPVVSHARFALPGFHLYMEKNGRFGLDGSPHFDVQHRNLDWSGIPVESLGNAVSFTLPIILPSSGAGLEVWDVDYADWVLQARHVPSGKLLASKESRLYSYSAGKICLMRGFPAHRIAPVKKCRPGDMRITFQGHAVRAKDRWIAYW